MSEEKRIRFPKFKERLNILKGDMTIKAFAKKIGVSLPTAGFYLNGDRLPDALGVYEIASKYEISADWLLGLSDTQLPDTSLRAAQEYTGLGELACEELRSWGAYNKKTGEDFLNTLSDLITLPFPFLKNMMSCICGGRENLSIIGERIEKNKNEHLSEDSLLQLCAWCQEQLESYRYTRFIMQDNAVNAFDRLLHDEYQYCEKEIDNLELSLMEVKKYNDTAATSGGKDL